MVTHDQRKRNKNQIIVITASLLAVASFAFAATQTGIAFIGWFTGLAFLIAALVISPKIMQKNNGIEHKPGDTT